MTLGDLLSGRTRPAWTRPRVFRLYRGADVSGVSGTGIVAEGIVFSDGVVALRWISKHRSTAIYGSIDDVRRIHGHDGKTRLLFDDELPRLEDM